MTDEQHQHEVGQIRSVPGRILAWYCTVCGDSVKWEGSLTQGAWVTIPEPERLQKAATPQPEMVSIDVESLEALIEASQWAVHQYGPAEASTTAQTAVNTAQGILDNRTHAQQPKDAQKGTQAVSEVCREEFNDYASPQLRICSRAKGHKGECSGPIKALASTIADPEIDDILGIEREEPAPERYDVVQLGFPHTGTPTKAASCRGCGALVGNRALHDQSHGVQQGSLCGATDGQGSDHPCVLPAGHEYKGSHLHRHRDRTGHRWGTQP